VNRAYDKSPRTDPVQNKLQKMTVAGPYGVMVADETDKLLDAIEVAENNGFVFIDEIDKITARGKRIGGDFLFVRKKQDTGPSEIRSPATALRTLPNVHYG
jgi:hypothetical protein